MRQREEVKGPVLIGTLTDTAIDAERVLGGNYGDAKPPRAMRSCN